MKMMFNGQQVVVTQAYNGKLGCMCGCMGNYVTDGGAAMKRRVNKVLSFVGPMRPQEVPQGAKYFSDEAGYSGQAFAGERHVFVNEGNRTTCVYFKAE